MSQLTTRRFPKRFNHHADEILYLLIKEGEMSGRNLRNRINKNRWFWQKWSRFKFYKLMADLEDAGIVKYREESVPFLPGENITRRIYLPADIDNVIGYSVTFIKDTDQPAKGHVIHQKGHKLYIRWAGGQCVRFAHEVYLTEPNNGT